MRWIEPNWSRTSTSPLGVPSAIAKIGIFSRCASRATSSGEMLLWVSLPSDSSTSTAGSRRVPVPRSFGTGVRASSSARWRPTAIAVPPSARRRSSAARTGERSVVGGAWICA